MSCLYSSVCMNSFRMIFHSYVLILYFCNYFVTLVQKGPDNLAMATNVVCRKLAMSTFSSWKCRRAPDHIYLVGIIIFIFFTKDINLDLRAFLHSRDFDVKEISSTILMELLISFSSHFVLLFVFRDRIDYPLGPCDGLCSTNIGI